VRKDGLSIQNLPNIEAVEQAREVLLEMDEEQEIKQSLTNGKRSSKSTTIKNTALRSATRRPRSSASATLPTS
jgi:UDP-N-acetylglucosamine enolpyruvyl transferase